MWAVPCCVGRKQAPLPAPAAVLSSALTLKLVLHVKNCALKNCMVYIIFRQHCFKSTKILHFHTKITTPSSNIQPTSGTNTAEHYNTTRATELTGFICTPNHFCGLVFSESSQLFSLQAHYSYGELISSNIAYTVLQSLMEGCSTICPCSSTDGW